VAAEQQQGSPTASSDLSGPISLQTDPRAVLDSLQRRVLNHWLGKHRQYAIIKRDFCSCADLYYSPGQTPYVAVGDFNQDGHNDFAILLEQTVRLGLSDEHDGPSILLVFNGPFSRSAKEPAFGATGWQVRDVAAVESDGHTLFVGTSESDNGYSFSAIGNSYELHYAGDGG